MIPCIHYYYCSRLQSSGLAQKPPAQDYLVLRPLGIPPTRYAFIASARMAQRSSARSLRALMEPDINSPHGLAVTPDKEHYFVSLGHGEAVRHSLEVCGQRRPGIWAKSRCGLFPATMDVSPDGNLLFVVNFNLHGDMVPSSVSVVLTDEMLEIKRITTCTMPHGSRFNPQGSRHTGRLSDRRHAGRDQNIEALEEFRATTC